MWAIEIIWSRPFPILKQFLILHSKAKIWEDCSADLWALSLWSFFHFCILLCDSNYLGSLNSDFSLLSSVRQQTLFGFCPCTAAWKLPQIVSWGNYMPTSFVSPFSEVTISHCLMSNVLRTIVSYILPSIFSCFGQEDKPNFCCSSWPEIELFSSFPLVEICFLSFYFSYDSICLIYLVWTSFMFFLYFYFFLSSFTYL